MTISFLQYCFVLFVRCAYDIPTAYDECSVVPHAEPRLPSAENNAPTEGPASVSQGC